MKKILIVLLLVVAAAFAVISWWMNGKSPVNPTNKTYQTFIVSPQENIRDVGYNLRKNSFIKSPVVFFLLVKQLGLDGKIQAGNFELSQSMSTAQVILTLTHGTTDIWVTLPEGQRATEYAETLSTKLTTYTAAWKDALVAQEGYLFPDTYLFPKNISIDQVITTMKNNFATKYQLASQGQTTKLTQPQVVILASMLEREGKSAEDMKMIASVLENRLSLNMPLQVDSSVQYALGYQPAIHSWWKKDLTLDDLKINSLYNTYTNPGLPPTPIANPGLNALTAVLHPATTSYLYYLSDAQGKLHFATTLDEHNANVRKYIQ